MGKRRAIAVTIALVVLGTLVGGCQPAKVGARCRTTDFGDDGGTWVLQCRNGRWQRALTKQRAAELLLAARSAASSATTAAPQATAVVGAEPAANDDYPAAWRNAPQDSVDDSWGYPNRQCTSFVAWRMANANRFPLPVLPGDASTWDEALAPYGSVDSRPAVGAIAQWNANEEFGGVAAGPLGHVGWVQAVYADGTVTVEQYNLGSEGRYAQFLHTRAPRYIHLRDL